jgi:hypothetical protein
MFRVPVVDDRALISFFVVVIFHLCVVSENLCSDFFNFAKNQAESDPDYGDAASGTGILIIFRMRG